MNNQTAFYLGSIVFLLGCLVTMSHIKYGGEIIIAGIVIFSLSFNSLQMKKLNSSETVHIFPNVLQSLGMTLLLIICIAVVSPLKMRLDELVGKTISSITIYLLYAGIPLLFFYNWRFQDSGIKGFNFKRGKWLTTLLILNCSLFITLGIANPLSGLIPISTQMLERMKELNHIEGFSSFFIIVIAAPILEELIYRGIVLDGLLKKYSPLFAILFSAFLFAIVHLNPWQFVVGMVMGVFNGWIYFKVRNVLYPILAHMSCNLVNFIIRYSHQINVTDAALPKQQHPIEIVKLIPGLIFFNLITLLFLYLLNNAFKKEYQSSIKVDNF